MGTRRGNYEGSKPYLRADGRWECKVMVGYSPDGKRIRKTVLGKSKAEAVEKANEAKVGVATRQITPTNSGKAMLFSEFLKQWLETVVKPNQSEKTYDNYWRQCKNHIIPALGGMRIDRISPMNVQAFVALIAEKKCMRQEKKEKPPKQGRTTRKERAMQRLATALEPEGASSAKPQGASRTEPTPGNSAALQPAAQESKAEPPKTLSKSSQFGIMAILNSAMSQAVQWGLITQNPCTAVEKPKVPKHIAPFWDADEARRFLDAAAGDRYYVLYQVALHSGLRFGEVLGLEWQQIDLATGKISVAQQLREVSGKHTVAGPKKNSVRTIPIPKSVVSDLVKHREKLMAEGLAGSRWVFPDANGGPLRQSNIVRRSFNPIVERAKVRRITFHGLRHSFATLLLSNGVDIRTVSELLGHADPAMTLRVYAHAMPGHKQAAADKLQEVLGQKAKKGRGSAKKVMAAGGQ